MVAQRRTTNHPLQPPSELASPNAVCSLIAMASRKVSVLLPPVVANINSRHVCPGKISEMGNKKAPQRWLIYFGSKTDNACYAFSQRAKLCSFNC